jgi:hypothetical protein
MRVELSRRRIEGWTYRQGTKMSVPTCCLGLYNYSMIQGLVLVQHTGDPEGGIIHTGDPEGGIVHTRDPEGGIVHTGDPEGGIIHTGV